MLEELQHFVLAVERGTLTEAARHAHLSQPALTVALQRLEARVGARLLHRGPGGVVLTAAGAAFLPRARASLAAFADGQRAVAEVEGLHAGEVRIGAGATVCTYLLPKELAAFRAAHPGVRFRLRELNPLAAEDALVAGEIDLAIVTSPRESAGATTPSSSSPRPIWNGRPRPRSSRSRVGRPPARRSIAISPRPTSWSSSGASRRSRRTSARASASPSSVALRSRSTWRRAA